MTTLAPIKLLVVDDSALMRALLTRLLAQEPGIEVIATARDGVEALEKTRTLHPDVVTLDVEMPRLDGLAALRAIMQECPTAVIMVSALTLESAEVTLAALEAGAVDFVTKPSATSPHDMETMRRSLVEKVLLTRSTRAPMRKRVALPPPASILTPRSLPSLAAPLVPSVLQVPLPPARASTPARSRQPDILVIGSSTGGPAALNILVPALPGNLGVPVVIVQHIPALFTGPLAQRLDKASKLTVREAKEGDALQPNLVLLAPGSFHMEITPDRRIHLTSDPPQHGVRPAVDVTLETAAQVFGAGTLAVVLTGMGCDGTRGAGAVRTAGGRVLVEDESTCVVYGMPRSIVEAGYADGVHPLHDLAGAITASCQVRVAQRVG